RSVPWAGIGAPALPRAPAADRWAVGRPCEFPLVDVGSRGDSAEYLARQAVTCPQIRLERMSRDSGFVPEFAEFSALGWLVGLTNLLRRRPLLAILLLATL